MKKKKIILHMDMTQILLKNLKLIQIKMKMKNIKIKLRRI